MKIRHKLIILNTFLIFTISLILIISVFYFLKAHINNSLKERAEIYKKNFLTLIEQEKRGLENTIKDYAMWKEMGENVVINRNDEWIKDNLDPWVKVNYGYNIILVVKSNNEVILNSSIINLNPSNFILNEKEIVSGVKIENNYPIIFATSPIYDNSGENFYDAYLTFGYLIDETVIDRWKRTFDVDLAIIGKNVYISTSKDIKKITFYENLPSYNYVDNYICTYFSLKDPLGEEVLKIHIHKYDETISKVTRSIYFNILFAGFITFFTVFIINIIVTYFVLKPLENFTKDVKKASLGDYDFKLDYKKNDEIGYLTNAFKKLFEKVKIRERIILKEKELAVEMSYKDPLTKIYNRKYFIESIEKYIKSGEQFSIVFLDLDNFKLINDVLGHKVGDEILKKVADWFSKNIRGEDVVTRYGGDEFCFILKGLDKTKANEVIERLYKLFQLQSFYPEDIPIGFSYGISSFPEDSMDIDKLLSIADKKMYQMKEIRFKK